MSFLRDKFPPLRGLLPLALLLIAWQVLQQGPSPSFPAPAAWWVAGHQLAVRGVLAPAVLSTLWTFFIGLALAGLLGFVLGLLIATVGAARRWTAFLLEYLRALPPPVMVPIAVLILGYSSTMKISVVVITAFWPVLLNTIAGVTTVQGLLMDVGRSLRMPWHARLLKIVIPATVPSLLLGLRIALPLAIVITLLVEMLTGLPGIGRLMIAGQRNFNSPQVFALLVVVGVLGFALNLIFVVVESAVLRRWPPRVGMRH
jgi:ABC-type nitrate/sulfonate/bicarbonate transport system permease component